MSGTAGSPMEPAADPARRQLGAGDGVLDGKHALRARIRRARAAMSASDRAAAAARLARAAAAAGLGGMATAGYIPTPSEPDVTGVLALASSVLLPVPLADRAMAWAPDDGSREPDPHLPVAIPGSEPIGVGAAALVAARTQLLLLPALAVCWDGVRLGQGGGYYDQLLGELAQLSAAKPRVVAVVFHGELLPAGRVAREEHDMTVSQVLTPSGLVRVGVASR